MLHSLKIEKIPGILFKSDIDKAYDKLNWKFIRKMLEAFGFNQNWDNWIMQLVSLDFKTIGPLGKEVYHAIETIFHQKQSTCSQI